MNEISPTPAAFEKFASGQSVSRKEDPRLLRGEGRFTGDIDLRIAYISPNGELFKI